MLSNIRGKRSGLSKYPKVQRCYAFYSGQRRAFARGETLSDAYREAKRILGAIPDHFQFEYYAVPEEIYGFAYYR